MKIIYIKWFDSCYNNTAQETEAIADYIILENCGFLVSENEKSVKISMEHSIKYGDWRHTLSIPKVNILKRKELKVKV